MNCGPTLLARKFIVTLVVLVCLSGNLCLGVKKDNPAEHIAMADDLLGRCNPAGAIVQYELALRLKPRLGSRVEKWLAVSHFMLAEKLAKEKSDSLALVELDNALKLRPKEGYWHLAKALLAARTGNLQLAKSECAAAIHLEKKDPGLRETCRNPAQRFRLDFTSIVPELRSDAFASFDAIKTDATDPVPLSVPRFGNEWPGSMVALIATISLDGKASNVQIVKPMGLGLDQKALRILREARFQPAMRKGRPIQTRSLVTILFGAMCHP